jgi:hypothetical protein
MGKAVRCPECGDVYRTLERIEDLRDNDGVCLTCNSPIEVANWDRILESYEEEDMDDVDDLDDLDEDDDDEDDFDEDDEDDDDEDFEDDD